LEVTAAGVRRGDRQSRQRRVVIYA
jgi:hypothetical protein